MCKEEKPVLTADGAGLNHGSTAALKAPKSEAISRKKMNKKIGKNLQYFR